MRSILAGILVACFLAGIGALFFGTDMTSVNGSQTATTEQSPQVAATSTGPQAYTLAQVATHNSASSCWSAIGGKVYDLTSWINQHPGGQAPILSLCGSDGSSAFNAQHGGQGRPEQELASFYIGDETQ